MDIRQELEYIFEQDMNSLQVINLSDEIDSNSDIVNGNIINTADDLLKKSIEDDKKYSNKFKGMGQTHTKGLVRRYASIGTILIIVQNNKTIALTMLHRGMVHDFIVDPMYRKKGVGSKLMDATVKTAKNQGYKYIELDVWDKNEDAKQFYLKHKFQPMYNKMRRNI